MFDKNSVGRRVVSEAYGKGVVRAVSNSAFYPVEVEWHGNEYNQKAHMYFTLEGNYRRNQIDTSRDLSLIPTKVGSPEARKIVAMLAREYRKELAHKDTTDLYKEGMLDTCKDLYEKAKQLLGAN